jgi:hypothetical protein
MIVLAQNFTPSLDENGELEIVQKGQKTIGFDEIGRRFKAFGLEFDDKALDGLNKIRTDIEHFFSNEEPEAIREVMAKAFPLAVSLFHLANKDPRTELGANWDVLMEVQQVYEKELEHCRASFKNVEWRSSTLSNASYCCPHCHSDLIIQDDPDWSHTQDADLKCLACGCKINAQEGMELALEKYFEQEAYLSMTDGDDAPLGTCPDCGCETYIMSDEEVGCANCGLVLEECGRCHTSLTPDNVDSETVGLCSYCGNLLHKDD